MKALKIVLFLTTFTSLFANEDTSHVLIKERTVSVEKQDRLEKERSKESRSNHKKLRAGAYFRTQTVQYPPFYFPTSTHWLSSVSILGDSLEIEDGSFWKIASGDEHKILYWQASDPLVITQNTNWFSCYDYKIINKADGSVVYANLSIGPIVEGEYTHWIVAIDYARGEIILEDYSHWKICSADDYVFDEWTLNDTVIIGVNSGWYSSTSEYILINVNMNNYIRASQY